MLGTLMLPYHVTLVPQYVMFLQLGWVNSFLPLIVPKFLAIDAFFIFLMVQFFRGIPREIDEAAIIDGCGPWRIYWKIMLPLSTPALATAAIFSFIWTYDDFLGAADLPQRHADLHGAAGAARVRRLGRRRVALRRALRHVGAVARAGLPRLPRLPAPDHPRRCGWAPSSAERDMPEAFDFAVSGINHNHIYGQVDALLGAGCRLKAFHAPEDDLAAAFAKVYPQARRVADEREILDGSGGADGGGRGHPRRPGGDGAQGHARRQGRDGGQAGLHHRRSSSPT